MEDFIIFGFFLHLAKNHNFPKNRAPFPSSFLFPFLTFREVAAPLKGTPRQRLGEKSKKEKEKMKSILRATKLWPGYAMLVLCFAALP